MNVEIPDINKIIEETYKNYERISAKKVEEICSLLNENIKEASSKGLSFVSYNVLGEFNGVINKIIELYKEKGYYAYKTFDGQYIEISWLK